MNQSQNKQLFFIKGLPTPQSLRKKNPALIYSNKIMFLPSSGEPKNSKNSAVYFDCTLRDDLHII